MRVRGVRLRGFVLIDQLLNGSLFIPARADEVFVGVLQIVLVESQLRLRNAELFLKRIFLSLGGLRQLLI